MKYVYYDLGEQPQDTRVVAHLRGSAANVILLDSVNFARYRVGESFIYTGGLHGGTPVALQIPESGHWYLAIDRGGYKHDVRAGGVEILPPDESATASEADAAAVGAIP